jgi:hypothetical protein
LTNISTLEILGIGVDASCEQLNKNTNAKNPMAWLNFFIESTNKRPKNYRKLTIISSTRMSDLSSFPIALE